MALGHTYGDIYIVNSQGVVVGDVIVQVGQQTSQGSKSEILLNSLTFDRWDARLRDISTALNTTCQWIFAHNKFQTWLDASQVSQHGGTLWLKGKPGSGKSTLMKEVVAWTKRAMPQSLIATYFFNARSPYELEKSSIGLYRSLTHQLLQAWPAGIALFTQMFWSKERGGRMVEEWRVTELRNFLLEFVTSGTLPRLSIFIDALDEGEEDDVRSMINGLVDMVQKSWSVNNIAMLCVSSRHYPAITIDRSLSVVLEEQYEHQQDIELYVQEKLRGRSDPRMQDLQQQVLNRSNGVFLWTVLVVPVLNKLYDRGCTIKLMAQRLAHVPQDLTDVFDTLMPSDAEDVQKCTTLFRWVLFSFRSLTPYELLTAVETSSNSPEDSEWGLSADVDEILPMEVVQQRVLHYSCGLVELITLLPPPIVQFIHETVRNFLLEGRNTNQLQPSIISDHSFAGNFQADQCHNEIAESCLQYLTTMADSSQSQMNSGEQNPLAGYAARYWWLHIQAANSMVSENVLTLATDLCLTENRLLMWVQNYDVDQPWLWQSEHYRPSLDVSDLYPPLYYAARIGFTSLVTSILERGADVNARRSGFSDEVHESSRNDHERITHYSIEDDDYLNGSFSTALQVAIADGHEKIVQILLEAGADVNARGDDDNGSALYVASRDGHENIVEKLLDRGADINAQGRNGTALWAASLKGHENVVRVLLEFSSKIDPKGFDTALWAASLKDHESLVQMLLEAGADVNARTDDKTVLWVASRMGHERIVQLLLKVGADVNARVGDEGSTALWVATKRGYEKIVEALLEAGADLDARASDNDSTALYEAVCCNHDGIAQILLKAGAYVDSEGRCGTPLYEAARCDSGKLAQMLLEAGADVNAHGSRGTPLHGAASSGSDKVARILLKAGADVAARIDEDDSTALYEAARYGHDEVVQILYEAGADIDTALNIASSDGDKTVLAILLKARANVDTTAKKA